MSEQVRVKLGKNPNQTTALKKKIHNTIIFSICSDQKYEKGYNKFLWEECLYFFFFYEASPFFSFMHL